MGSYPDEFPFNIMDVVELLHLRIRRQQSNSVYVDCPFCGDRRGKMNVNFVKNVWRCNYCGEHGGMLGLYARLNNTTTSDAYWEIAEALCDNCHEEHIRSGNEAPKLTVSTGSSLSGARADAGCHSTSERKTVPQSEKASPAEIHQTLSLLLAQLTLRPAHREHLRSPKRGLSDEQIESLGFKSTPPPFLCRSITARLIKMGCKVEGVPGFYRDDCGYWTMAFYKKTSGILIPAVGFDGRLQGFQIMLDVPLKDKDDPPEKAGAKYIWFSSSSKRDGASSESPVHLVGDPSARVVYVIEGLLKADISHCLTGRTFAAIAGANNTNPLDTLFALLAQNGTEEIIEAHDMDILSSGVEMGLLSENSGRTGPIESTVCPIVNLIGMRSGVRFMTAAEKSDLITGECTAKEKCAGSWEAPAITTIAGISLAGCMERLCPAWGKKNFARPAWLSGYEAIPSLILKNTWRYGKNFPRWSRFGRLDCRS